MNRVPHAILMVFVLLACLSPQTLAQPAEPGATGVEAAANVSGKCLSVQAELKTIQNELEWTIQSASDRLAAVNAALIAIGQSRRGDQERARILKQEAIQIRERIERHWALLRGEARPVAEAMTRQQIEAEIRDDQHQQARIELLSRAYALQDPIERQQFEASLAFEKENLEHRIQAMREPFRSQLDRLREQARELGDELESAFIEFGRSEPVGPVQVEAFRLSSRFEHGLISYSWMDRRGQLVASADLNLRPRPDTNTTPPLLDQRYPILQHDNQQVVLSVGYFEVRFRSSAPGMMGNQRVLEAVGRLLDLEALGDLVPLVSGEGQN